MRPPACESELALTLSVAARAADGAKRGVVDIVVPTPLPFVKLASFAPLPPLPTDAPTLTPPPRFPFAAPKLPGPTLLENPPWKSTLDEVVGVLVGVNGAAAQKPTHRLVNRWMVRCESHGEPALPRLQQCRWLVAATKTLGFRTRPFWPLPRRGKAVH
jgi:hypothetical protein